jgi:hypothetical protein
MQHGRGHAMRIDDDAVVREKLDEVDAADGGILVLLAAREGKVEAFDLVGQMSDVIGTERRGVVGSEGFDKGNDQGGG